MSSDLIDKILARPYARVILPESESGTCSAFIPDFRGCVSQGDTPTEALDNLEDAARAWLDAMLDMGQLVPEPSWYRKIPGLGDVTPEELEQ